MESTRIPTLEDVQRAIDKPDRREALIRSEQIMKSGKHFQDSAFWMQRAQVMLMNKEPEEALHCISQANGLGGYDPKEYESFLRQMVWFYVSNGKAKAALVVLDEFEGWYKEPADLAWWHASRGACYFTEAGKTLLSRVQKAELRELAAQEFEAAEMHWQELDASTTSLEFLRKESRLKWYLTLVAIDTVKYQRRIEELFVQLLKESDLQRRLKIYAAKPGVAIGWFMQRLLRELG